MASFFFLVVLKLLISLIRADRLTLRHLTESPLALCNDGTSATYHFTEEGLDNPNILIYLQGGGACVNNEDCENRCAQTDFCTANLMPTIEKETTFWSQTSQENPFRDYAKAYVHYCSSDLWSGTREASQETNGLNFYGKYIVDAVVTDIIKKKPNIENTTRVVLMGTSAGAFGVNLNCDFVADKFHEVNPELDVRCISDSADFYPAWVHTENCDPYLQPAMLTEFWQSKRDVSCEEQSTAGSVECSMFTSYYNFIETPLMVVGRFIDTTVRGECTPELDQDPEFWKLWQEEVYSLALMFIGDKPANGLFLLNCPGHVLVNDNYGWQDVLVPDINNESMLQLRKVMENWISGDGGPYQALDIPLHENMNCNNYANLKYT